MHRVIASLLLVLLQEPPVALQEITLLGKADNAVYQVRLAIKAGKEPRLQCRWVDSYGFGYEVDAPIKSDEWNRLKALVAASLDLKSLDTGVSHAVDWDVRIKTEDREHSFTVRGEEGSHQKLIDGLLEARDRCLAFAKRIEPTPIEAGRGMRRGHDGASRRLLLPAKARARAASILAATDGEPLLPSACFVNAEVVDAFVALLDRDHPSKAAAACAALSWISGRPPSEDARAWKEWWKAERGTWAPEITVEGTGVVGQGTVRALGRGQAGFEDVEVDPQGGTWALADQVYRLEGDSWKPSGPIAKAEANYDPENRLDFLRRLADPGFTLKLRHDGLSVSGDGKRGVAIMGTEANAYLTEVLGVFDFEKRTWKRVVQGRNSLGHPVLNHDGSLAAVAEGWGWAPPNGVSIYETNGGKLVATPDIPKAETLFPIGWSDGAFTFFRDEVEQARDGDFEIWKYAIEEKKATRVFAYPKSSRYWVGVRTRIPVTPGGRSILVRKGTGMGRCILGFLDLTTEEFSPVSADGRQIDRHEMSADGTRVVFLREGIPFEWRKK